MSADGSRRLRPLCPTGLSWSWTRSTGFASWSSSPEGKPTPYPEHSDPNKSTGNCSSVIMSANIMYHNQTPSECSYSLSCNLYSLLGFYSLSSPKAQKATFKSLKRSKILQITTNLLLLFSVGKTSCRNDVYFLYSDNTPESKWTVSDHVFTRLGEMPEMCQLDSGVMKQRCIQRLQERNTEVLEW